MNFGSLDYDAFNYDPKTGATTGYQFNLNGQSDLGALTWNANGTLQSLVITDAFNGADTQACTYRYDDLERIASANCGAIWAQTFGFDAFGNLTKSGSMSFQPFYSSATNRMTSFPGGFTPTYDSNGNVLDDANHQYTWNSDNKAVTIDGIGQTYDALNRVVEQNRSGVYNEFVYAPTGEKLALMSGQTLQKAFIPLPGKSTAVTSPAQFFASGVSQRPSSPRPSRNR